MSEIPILVVSCDRYRDVWRPFFEVFRRRWPDCPYPLHLGTNEARCAQPGVTTLAVGPDTTWADNVHRMLDRLESEYVMMFLEDFLLTAPVETAEVRRYEGLFRERDFLAGLRLKAGDFAGRPLGEPGLENLGELGPRLDYRVSTQVGFWRVAALRELLDREYTPWDFEWLGSMRSASTPWRFWAVLESVIDYQQSVERGLWRPEGPQICDPLGVEIDYAARRAMTGEEVADLRRKHARKRWTNRIPGPLRYLIRRLKYRRAGLK